MEKGMPSEVASARSMSAKKPTASLGERAPRSSVPTLKGEFTRQHRADGIYWLGVCSAG